MQDIALEESSETRHRFVKLLRLTADKLRSDDDDGDERYVLPDDLRLLLCAESLVAAHQAAVDVDREAAVYLVAAMRHIGERLVTRFGAGGSATWRDPGPSVDRPSRQLRGEDHRSPTGASRRAGRDLR